MPNLNLRIVADNSQTSPDLYVLLVPKNSPLTSIAQLKGKKVGFPAPGFNFGSMAADILMKPYNESSADFTTVVLPFSAAPQALATAPGRRHLHHRAVHHHRGGRSAATACLPTC